MLKLKAQVLEILERSPYRQSPEAEADLILLHVLKQAHPELKNLSDLKTNLFEANGKAVLDAILFANERASGVPLQYILGEQYFFDHDYQVDSSTLIPRPETEILVQEAIQYISKNYRDDPFQFAELGLGTGIISAEILCRFKNARGVASEINPKAISLAHQNLARVVGPSYESRFTTLNPSEATTGFEIFVPHGPFDLLFSNPPYVSSLDEISPEVLKNEPAAALFPKTGGPENPDYFYENFLTHGHLLLKPKGVVFFEVPHERAQNILLKFRTAGYSSARLIPDLTGRDRVLQASF